jgi:hypothetical protein
MHRSIRSLIIAKILGVDFLISVGDRVSFCSGGRRRIKVRIG